MKFKADEIASVIQKEIEDFRGRIETSEVGRVLEVGDGIARCYGLSSAMSCEIPSLAKAKLRVNAARMMKKIIPVVRTVDMKEAWSISQVNFAMFVSSLNGGSTDCRTPTLASTGNRATSPVRLKNIAPIGFQILSEFSIMPITSAPDTPKAAASPGVAIPM